MAPSCKIVIFTEAFARRSGATSQERGFNRRVAKGKEQIELCNTLR
jgi:hypothetical protein